MSRKTTQIALALCGSWWRRLAFNLNFNRSKILCGQKIEFWMIMTAYESFFPLKESLIWPMFWHCCCQLQCNGIFISFILVTHWKHEKNFLIRKPFLVDAQRALAVQNWEIIRKSAKFQSDCIAYNSNPQWTYYV